MSFIKDMDASRKLPAGFSVVILTDDELRQLPEVKLRLARPLPESVTRRIREAQIAQQVPVESLAAAL